MWRYHLVMERQPAEVIDAEFNDLAGRFDDFNDDVVHGAECGGVFEGSDVRQDTLIGFNPSVGAFRRFRPDFRCGCKVPALPDTGAVECDPHSATPCCGAFGWCGGSPGHCDCPECVDYRKTFTCTPRRFWRPGLDRCERHAVCQCPDKCSDFDDCNTSMTAACAGRSGWCHKDGQSGETKDRRKNLFSELFR